MQTILSGLRLLFILQIMFRLLSTFTAIVQNAKPPATIIHITNDITCNFSLSLSLPLCRLGAVCSCVLIRSSIKRKLRQRRKNDIHSCRVAF